MNAIISALGTVLVALVGYLAQKVAVYLKERGISEKLANKQYLVDIAVKSIEQIYVNEQGEAKFNLAKQEALKLLNDNGFEVDDHELQAFIEASVKAMNEGFYSVKRGCETSNCGLCTVYLDGKPILSCSTLAVRANGRHVTTMEGVQEEATEFINQNYNQEAEETEE